MSFARTRLSIFKEITSAILICLCARSDCNQISNQYILNMSMYSTKPVTSTITKSKFLFYTHTLRPDFVAFCFVVFCFVVFCFVVFCFVAFLLCGFLLCGLFALWPFCFVAFFVTSKVLD